MGHREAQRAYYERTSSEYDSLHVVEGDEHYVGLQFMAAFMREFNYGSVLDVGAGTGRAVAYLTKRFPDADVRGIEPVDALIDEARARGVEAIAPGEGEHLPFPDSSFDCVCEFGVLHHVKDPVPVVEEMCRVARSAVFLSDYNRFAGGRKPGRLLKLGLYKAGLWRTFFNVRTRGRGYVESEGDGIAYSYSVYDSYVQLAEWANRVVMVPTGPATSTTWAAPLLSSTHVLVAAFR